MLSEEYKAKGHGYHDGIFDSTPAGMPGAGLYPVIDACKLMDGKWRIEYHLYMSYRQMDKDNSNMVAIMEIKTIDERDYWTIHSLEHME